MTVTPAGGQVAEVGGIFRRRPIEVIDSEGMAFMVVRPSLRISAAEGVSLPAGSLVVAGGGNWVVVAAWPSGSPAADAFTIYELEENT